MASDTSDQMDPREDVTLASSSSILEGNNDIAFRVYEEVWDEFNRWKAEDSRQQLRLLQRPLPPPNVAEATRMMALTLRTGDPDEVETIRLCDTDDDIPLDAGGATVLTCKNVLLEFQEPVTGPHPRYEFCTPSVQSIAFRIESVASDELETVPFVPYADNPDFDARDYLAQFKCFAWEHLADPDVEAIQFEVVRRLNLGYGLSLDDIDAANVLPALRPTNRDGLIYKMTRRDPLFWPGIIAEFPVNADGSERRGINPRAHEPDIDDLRKRIESIAPYFCANPSCVQVLCPYHPQHNPPVPRAVPRVASNDYPKGSSCGSMCFREIDLDSMFKEDSIVWEAPEIDELRCILDIIPDTVPCGLAKLVRKPCREVFVQRCRYIPDDGVYPESSQTRDPGMKTSERYQDENCTKGEYIPPGPCSHRGPCDIDTPECICAKESVHCTRNCHCNTTCNRRWKGCRCDRGLKKTCAVESDCSCRKKGWECDPMVCNCDNLIWLSRKKNGKRPAGKKQRETCRDGEHFCQNSDMQRGIPVKLEIRRGAYGLGAFAVESIRKYQFIGEYIGELLSTKDDGREIMRKHLGLNYSFGLNKDYHIDSARVGNETRFINHGEGGEANSTALTKLVLGDLRIGFYSLRQIKANEEILFDYGEDYWEGNHSPEESVVT